MKAFRLLNLRRMRRQPLRAFVGVVSVAAGVALAVSVAIVQHSLDQSVRDFGRTLAGPAPLRVVGSVARGGLDASVLDRVRAVDGVQAAVPIVQAIAFAVDARGEDTLILAFGIDCSIEQLLGSFGCDNASVAEAGEGSPPALSSALAARLGRGALLRTDDATIPLDDAFAIPELSALNRGNVAVLGLPVAQRRFAREGSLDAIYVVPDAGVSLADLRAEIEVAAGPWNTVLDGSEPPPGARAAAAIFVPLFGLFSLFALAVGVILIRNTVSLTLEERRRDLAIVAAVGGTGRLVVGGAVAESALLGLVGGLLGAAGGYVLAHPIVGSLGTFTERIEGLHLSVHGSLGLVVFAAGLGMAVAMLSALGPARQATRLDVAAELSNRDLRDEIAPGISVRRTILWLIVSVTAIDVVAIIARNGALEPWQPAAAQAAFGLACVALTSAVGTAAPPLLEVIVRRVPLRGAAKLGAANLVRDPRRTRVGVVATSIAVGVAFTLGNAAGSLENGVREGLTTFDGQVSVSGLPSTNSINIDAKLSPTTLKQLAALPSVDRIERTVILSIGAGATDLSGVAAEDTPAFPFRMLRGQVDRDAFMRGEVLIGAGIARRLGVGPGDRLRLPGRTGWVDLRVQAVWRDGDFNGSRVYMPMATLLRGWGEQPPSYVGLVPVPGATEADVAREVRAAGIDPFLRVQTSSELVGDIIHELRAQLAPFWALQRGMLAVAFIAVLFTLLLAAVQRRRELALLGAVGMQPRELARMVVGEALVIGVVGMVLGVFASMAFSLAVREVLTIVIGYDNPVSIDSSSLIVALPLALVVVVAASAWPAWRTARVEILDGLRYE